MEKIFELRVEKRDGRVVFELWRNGQEEPIAKHEVKLSSGYFATHECSYSIQRAFDQEVHRWLVQELRKLDLIS